MTLTTIPLDQLKISPLNVRKKGGKEIADLVPSIRSLGLIQPLLVRQNCEGYEIVAGQRRFHALCAIAAEGGAVEAVPCIVMGEGDDAKAVEASLAENIARLPMDEIDQYKAFATLRGEGLDVGEIAVRFGVTSRLVEQRLAIAGIIPPILNAYRREEIVPETLRILTMATPRQQKAWWALFKAEDAYAPQGGRSLREWLFGGAQIPVTNALFDLADYSGAVVADLFGEERYFADAEAFWDLQGKAVAAKREACLASGWQAAHILGVGERFATWEHRKMPKKKGGAVYFAIAHDGEVTIHEGWLGEKEAKKREKASREDEPQLGTPTPEARSGGPSKPLRTYVGLHKHAAVRLELLSHPAIALRLAVAHMIAGSALWSLKPERQKAEGEATAASLAGAKSMPLFEEERAAIAGLLGFEGDEGSVVRHGLYGGRDLTAVLERLIGVEDGEVLRILAFVMAETLEAHSPVVERLGLYLQTDMRHWWSPDQAFFDLVRDRESVNAMLGEVAGDITAGAHRASTAKIQKKIIADCLSGEGRAKVEGWLPRWMEFAAGDGLAPVATLNDSDVAEAA